MAIEIAFTVEWQIWIPVCISLVSLLMSIRSSNSTSRRATARDIGRQIDRSIVTLAKCEENLQQCGREKDELRRENIELMYKLAHSPRNDGE
jgi:hypothetical protein